MTLQVEMGDLDSDDNGLYFLGDLRFTGEAVETLEDGSLMSLTTYADGVESGPHRLWHANGNLEFSCELRDGNPVGLARAWRVDGSLEEEQQFDDAGGLLWSRRPTDDGDPAGETTPRSA